MHQLVTPGLTRGPPVLAAEEEEGGCRIKSGMTNSSAATTNQAQEAV